jgi:hypothetical protein
MGPERKFNIGDVVKLKSSGNTYTVKDYRLGDHPISDSGEYCYLLDNGRWIWEFALTNDGDEEFSSFNDWFPGHE